jgi:hypothetical protein
MSIAEKIEKLCKEFELSDMIKDYILELCKDSYISGSNDCFNNFFINKYNDTERKIRPTNR